MLLPAAGDILEIGPGNGDFLLALAAKHPKKKIVAIEIREKRFLKIAKRLKNAELKNVLLLHGDARVVLPRYFEGVEFEKIYILFPDPWPKQRHAFHRLLNRSFLALLALHLKPKGEWIVATDSEEYAASTAEIARTIADLKTVSFERDFHETFFEKVWKREGKEITYLCYKKL